MLRLTDATAERLCVDLKTAAAWLSVSVWTLRSWIDEGRITKVQFPGRHPGEVSRRVLIAVEDLKAFVDQHREGAAR